MRNHWKRLAERADKAAFSPAEVADALPVALMREFQEAPLAQLMKVLGVGEQQTLFSSHCPESLEQLRFACPGSAVGNALIDCALEAVANSLTGEKACLYAIENALDESTRSAFRGIEEHYYREVPDDRARFVRSRMDEARRQCDFGALANSLINESGNRTNDTRLSKQDGLDEGPEL